MTTKTITPHSIIAKHYGTSSMARKTTIAEFNADGEYMGRLKNLWLSAEAKWRGVPVEKKEDARQVADRIKKYVFKKSKELHYKHYTKN